MNTIGEEYKTMYKNLETVSKDFEAKFRALPQTQENIPTYQQYIDQYAAQVQATISQYQQLAAKFVAIPPVSGFENAKSLITQGMNTELSALDQIVSILLEMKNPAMAGAALNKLASVTALGEQGNKQINDGLNQLVYINWPFVIILIVVLLVVGTAFGILGGKIASNNGRGFRPFFIVSFLLGPIGVLITWLVTRNNGGAPLPLVQPAYPGTPGPPVQPGPNAFRPEGPSQPDPYAAHQVTPPGEAVYFSPSDAFSSTVESQPKRKKEKKGRGGGGPPAGQCPHCGAPTNPSLPFCPTCRKSIGRF